MDANKKGSRKEQAAASDAKPTAKHPPLNVIRVDDVSVSIFAHERETGGVKRVNYSCSFQRSYKDSAGAWKRTQWFGLDELGKVASCAKQAHEYLTSLDSGQAHGA